jgi:hypothetical protein
MKRALSLLLVICSAAILCAAQPRTMRVDYYHTGNAKTETFSLDRTVIEPLPWPGDMNRTVDDTNLGRYLFEVHDKQTGKLLYSRGFSSVYGEWETTDEAKQANRSFSESLRFPAPDKIVEIVLKKRDAKNAFAEAWRLTIDPKDIFIDRATPPSAGPLIEIEKHGDSATKVDFLIMGDGYTKAERGKCEKDAQRLTAILFSTSPFRERRSDFNVWALCPEAAESGISRPSTGKYRRPPAGSSYDAFGSERYILTYENRAMRDLASQAPYEFIEILTNSNTYGGGGIFGLYSTVAADSLWSPYVFVHEFGHHFAGLADEYYTSDVAYGSPTEKIEPWEPNATALLDPKLLKWRDLVAEGTPIPTPWNKKEFETFSRAVQARRRQIRKENRPEAEMDALFQEERKEEERMLGSEKYAGKVGAFEGANYEATGYYRPQTNCIMFTRTDAFCKVCQAAIERVINLYSGK